MRVKEIPRMYRIKQNFNVKRIENVEEAIADGISQYKELFFPGAKIGIAVGSRGIYQIPKMVKAAVAEVKKHGAIPHIIPAMGSHGGATAEGQEEYLKGYGITEETVGAPVLSSMEVEQVGTLEPEGMPVYCDKIALAMDGLIMLNRIKPHTDFHDITESGLLKQMAIGFGNHIGALAIHEFGIYGLAKLIPRAARVIMEKAPILLGIAVLENAEDTTAIIEVLPKDKIEEREKELIIEAKKLMPSLPFRNADVLVVQKMGKNISGVGMDSNITGRILVRGQEESDDLFIYRIVCLDLTEESHHNALGIGLADVITRRLYEKVDLETTYANVICSGFLERGFIPIIQNSDRDAILTALSCCNRKVTMEDARVALIKNTLEVKEILVSEALLEQVKERDYVEVLGEEKLEFDPEGNLKQDKGTVPLSCLI
ncbi:MAG: DUF2088 domain-containing protein [Clostridia bacterium]|nr:DUF2088 domain-containing protein [Clostridia bacterium]